MKTNLNQNGRPGVVAAIAVVLSLLGFPLSKASAPSYAGVESIVVRLPPGVTGEAIQRALDALPDFGGEVVLPPGEIVIRQPVVLRRDFQILRGSGPATVLWLADDANCPVIILGEPVNSPKQTVKNLRVGDFAINGNRAHQERELWKLAGEGSEIRNNGITVQGVTDSVIENVTSARCRSGGLVTTRDVRRLTVRGLDAFDNEFDGLACYQTEDCLFRDLYLHDNPGAGISLDLAFNHNVISNAVLNANDLGVFMRASRNNQFCNVSIRNSHQHGVFMAHAETQTAHGWGPAPKTECTKNSFTNLSAVNCGGAAFRVNNNSCTNNVIVRATFNGNRKGGLSQAQPNLVTLQ
ncbi:MAG: right-handed parallel beta-helix repeat-containing protein [Verrucomicrobiota bacterium]